MKDELKPLQKRINLRILNIKKKLESQNTPLHDPRIQTFGVLNLLMMWVSYQDYSLKHNLSTTNSDFVRDLLSNNPQNDQSNLSHLLQQIDIMTLRSFLTNFLFVVETFFQSINSTFFNLEVTPFSKLIDEILTKLKIGNHDKHSKKILVALYIRNTLHSNGIHLHPNTIVDFEGYTFTFSAEHKIEYSWYHVYFLCDKILDVLQLILDVKKIKDTEKFSNPTRGFNI